MCIPETCHLLFFLQIKNKHIHKYKHTHTLSDKFMTHYNRCHSSIWWRAHHRWKTSQLEEEKKNLFWCHGGEIYMQNKTLHCRKINKVAGVKSRMTIGDLVDINIIVILIVWQPELMFCSAPGGHFLTLSQPSGELRASGVHCTKTPMNRKTLSIGGWQHGWATSRKWGLHLRKVANQTESATSTPRVKSSGSAAVQLLFSPWSGLSL